VVPVAAVAGRSAGVVLPEEREAVLSMVRDYLAATPQTASGEFTFPMWTLAQRTVRR